MNQASGINKVRRKVLDWFGGNDDEQVYSDDYYIDALESAVGRLNSDIEQSYSLATIPAALDWVVILLATIEMAHTRAFESQASTTAGGLKRMEVEGFEGEFYEKQKLSAKDWLDLAQELEDKYQDWLDKEIEQTPELAPSIQQSTLHTNSSRTGFAYHKSQLDRGITAPAVSAEVNVVGDVVLTWSPVYHTQFYNYRIDRVGASVDWEDEDSDYTTLIHLFDNHTARYKDKTFSDLADGDYKYRLVVVNKNLVEKYSEAEVTKE